MLYQPRRLKSSLCRLFQKVIIIHVCHTNYTTNRQKEKKVVTKDIQNNKICELGHLNKITTTLFMYTCPFLTYVLYYNTMQSGGWL